MTDWMNTEEFAARVATPLKAPVTLDAGFEARVMRAVEEASRPWWQRSRTFTLSPIGGLALAAGFAGLMVLGALGGARMLGDAPVVAAAAPDTVHVVRFIFVEPTARSVALAGDFNGWSRTATPLSPADGSGAWTVTVPITAGRHEYSFIVDGERWVADPYALASLVDEFGIASSVLLVGGDERRGT
ncbi:MAG: isoamylase early set domain-containing protein [Gemmatimonadaceae bacterium]